VISTRPAPPWCPNTGTINIDIGGIQSGWPVDLDPDIIPILMFDPGVPNSSGNSADLTPIRKLFLDAGGPKHQYQCGFTVLSPGSSGGMIIGHDQIASGFPYWSANG